MAPNFKQKARSEWTVFQPDGDRDGTQDAGGPRRPLTQKNRASDSADPLPSKKQKASIKAAGKENQGLTTQFNTTIANLQSKISSCTWEDDFHLDSIASTIDTGYGILPGGEHPPDTTDSGDSTSAEIFDEKGLNQRGGYSSHSLESRLLTSIVDRGPYDSGNKGGVGNDDKSDEFEPCPQLDMLLKLCSQVKEQDGISSGTDSAHQQNWGCNSSPFSCPLCGTDISDLTDESRQAHTNDCLDKDETLNLVSASDDVEPCCPGQVVDGSPIISPQKIIDLSPVRGWLRSLGLAKYEEIFVQEEVDWDSLFWLTEEDLFSMGVTALGPRKKIVHALLELRKESGKTAEIRTDAHPELRKRSIKTTGTRVDASTDIIHENNRPSASKLITDYFPGSVGQRKKDCTSSSKRREIEKSSSDSVPKKIVGKRNAMNKKFRDIPQWCCIPGTVFRVDAFKYLSRDCSHWFLTHFHIDHYQGLTRSFSHGKIYCSLTTAKLVNLKIGIPWDNLQILPLNQKINIAGTYVTCFDANHCPGSVIILFEPPNGKAVLHTGDFRFCEEMAKIPVLQMCCVPTLILDTTYCNPQYDFPKQEAVIQFVIEAIQAEAFNPKTLFLIGSYTIGKERLFLEVARVLREKVYVNAAKLRLLECMGLSAEDMQWFTVNEKDSRIHIVPMWTLASFKRLKCISNQYADRFSLVVAFSPTGWSFGKGKKKSTGRRWQQGTIVRYEVPYSEHCSFTELREFVKLISPGKIIPSVNNDGPESADAMISLLVS